MRLRAGDRFSFKGLDGDTMPPAGQMEITITGVTYDGNVRCKTMWSGGGMDIRVPLSDAAKMIELGVWEPVPVAAVSAGDEPCRAVREAADALDLDAIADRADRSRRNVDQQRLDTQISCIDVPALIVTVRRLRRELHAVRMECAALQTAARDVCTVMFDSVDNLSDEEAALVGVLRRAAGMDAQETLERAVQDAATAKSRAELLEQDEYWLDRAGQLVRVDDMPWSYLSALQKFLENKSGRRREALALATFRELDRWDPPEHVVDDIYRGMDEDDALPPGAYMSRYPLYRRISVLLGDRRFAVGG